MADDIDPDPYAAPKSGDAGLPDQIRYFRQGDLLLIRDGATLPARCIKTNRPVGPEGWTGRINITWSPSWAWLLLLIAVLMVFLPYFDWVRSVGWKSWFIVIYLPLPAITLSLTLKRAVLTYSLALDLRKNLIRRRMGALAISILGVVVAVSSSVFHGGIAGAWIGGILAVAGRLAMGKTDECTVKSYRDGWFALKGCSREFLDSL